MVLAAAAAAAAGAEAAAAARGTAARRRATAAASPAAAPSRRRRPPPLPPARAAAAPPSPPAPTPTPTPSTTTSTPTPERPLCRRPPDHEASLSDLLAWRAEALRDARALVARPPAALGGDAPSAEDLARELGWVLEDAVAGWRTGGGGGGGDGSGSSSGSSGSIDGSGSGSGAGSGSGNSGGGTSAPAWNDAVGWRELAGEADDGRGPGSGENQGRGSDGAAADRANSSSVRLRLPLPALRALWRRRLDERAPHQYLIATAHWRDLVLSVGPGVLVPRPETEMMVDLAEAALSRQEEEAEAQERAAAAAAATGTAPAAAPGVGEAAAAASPAVPPPAWRPWADLGTGSGAIAIGLARMLLRRRRQRSAATVAAAAAARGGLAAAAAAPAEPTAPALPLVFAVDKSPAAVAYARHNSRVECGLENGEVAVLEGGWRAALEAPTRAGDGGGGGGGGGGARRRRSFGGVLSNPPYVPRREMPGLQAEVGLHEPASALDGGDGEGDGCLRDVVAAASEMLAPGGFLALETAGGAQAAGVAALLRAQRDDDGEEQGGVGRAWADVELVDDCYGKEGRFVTAYRT